MRIFPSPAKKVCKTHQLGQKSFYLCNFLIATIHLPDEYDTRAWKDMVTLCDIPQDVIITASTTNVSMKITFSQGAHHALDLAYLKTQSAKNPGKIL